MFYFIKELVEQADKDFNDGITELMIITGMELSGYNHDEIIYVMTENLQVMENSVTDRLTPSKSVSGLTGRDVVEVNTYLKSGKTLLGTTILAIACNAIAINELNAKMGLVYATPTTGSTNCLPTVLVTAIDKLELSEEEQLNFLFTVGTFGLVTENNTSISDAKGGCQVEVGSASTINAVTSVKAAGDSAFQASQAVALAIKNILGLTCDSVTGLVEVPCAKCNALGSSFTLVAADMTPTGIEPQVPADEVVDATHQVGAGLPTVFREIVEGGLAATPTGRRLQAQIFEEQSAKYLVL